MRGVGQISHDVNGRPILLFATPDQPSAGTDTPPACADARACAVGAASRDRGRVVCLDRMCLGASQESSVLEDRVIV
jgi:hypothetical protein